jgi:NAD(P)-dependent dehydrogenase (short-subunit alcohol dehydrogenase family)
MTDRLKDKVAVITGATKGIGAAAVRLFTQEGCNVVFSGRTADLGHDLEREIAKSGAPGKAIFQKADIGNSGEIRATIETAVREFGKLTNLLNVAASTDAFGKLKPTLELEDEDYLTMLQAALIGGMVTPVKYAVPHMRAAGRGSVVTISASSGSKGNYSSAPYHAAKGAEIALTMKYALEFARDKIRFNVLAPGFVDTDTPTIRALKNTPALFKIYDDAHLLGVGEPSDLAYAALWLCSDESKWVTGEHIAINGGLTSYVPMRGLESEEASRLRDEMAAAARAAD